MFWYVQPVGHQLLKRPDHRRLVSRTGIPSVPLPTTSRRKRAMAVSWLRSPACVAVHLERTQVTPFLALERPEALGVASRPNSSRINLVTFCVGASLFCGNSVTPLALIQMKTAPEALIARRLSGAGRPANRQERSDCEHLRRRTRYQRALRSTRAAASIEVMTATRCGLRMSDARETRWLNGLTVT